GGGAQLQVEFVSAYPTGPLTILHGRSAAVGDALANLFAWTGYEVQREFYVNDAGEQMERLPRSVESRYLELCSRPGPRPDDGYGGRTRAGLQALGIDARWLEVLILGPVSFKVDGLRVEGLNRKSYAIMLNEMIRELGAPAARLALLERPVGAPLELGLDPA